MLLQLEHIDKRYDSPANEGDPPVLRDVNLQLDAGQSMAIVGPSGSGKSTLLNIIGTLDRPTAGRVLFEGRDLVSLTDEQLAQLRRDRLGWVFQSHHLLPQLSVLENVLVPTLVHGGATSAARQRARRLLDRVGLGHRLAHRPAQLSGGERQRVAVVRALINQPVLLLADEPTGALDRHAATNLAGILLDLNREEGVALIVVTHALDLAGSMQRVFELRDGRVLAAEMNA